MKSESSPEVENSVEILSALLDYYSDRATSFASLFVASVFGLVTLAAMILTFAGAGDSPWYYIAGIPYFAFVLAGVYTWTKFASYATIAHNIEYDGLRLNSKSKIEKIPYRISFEGTTYETNLYENIGYLCSEQTYHPIKSILEGGKYSFAVLYFILIGSLTIISYWNFLNFLLSQLLNPVSLWFILGFIIAFIVIIADLGRQYAKAKNKRDSERVKPLKKVE